MSIICQINQIHIIPSYFLKFLLNLNSRLQVRLSSRLILTVLRTTNLYIFLSSHTYYTPSPSLSLLDSVNLKMLKAINKMEPVILCDASRNFCVSQNVRTGCVAHTVSSSMATSVLSSGKFQPAR
jgi:hypothetical protein